jgi:hypothetical protein
MSSRVHGVWAPLRGRSHAAGVAGVTRYQRMLTASPTS